MPNWPVLVKLLASVRATLSRELNGIGARQDGSVHTAAVALHIIRSQAGQGLAESSWLCR